LTALGVIVVELRMSLMGVKAVVGLTLCFLLLIERSPSEVGLMKRAALGDSAGLCSL